MVVLDIWLQANKQWGYKAGNNAQWNYPLTLTTLLFVTVDGDADLPAGSYNRSKNSAITYADTKSLYFATDESDGSNWFLVLGK